MTEFEATTKTMERHSVAADRPGPEVPVRFLHWTYDGTGWCVWACFRRPAARHVLRDFLDVYGWGARPCGGPGQRFASEPYITRHRAWVIVHWSGGLDV